MFFRVFEKGMYISMSLNNTPNANRVHIGFYGKRNSGKSSLINSFVGQEVAIVSAIPGTTTDPVYKAMEIQGIGACVLIDTAGFDDDDGSLGEMRVEKTAKAAEKTDIAVLLFYDEDIEKELEWFKLFKERGTPILCVISKADIITDIAPLKRLIKEKTGINPIIISRKDNVGLEVFKESLIRLVPEDYEMPSITSYLVNDGDIVMLVMPQDIQAPKGRLILPQVQTIRDLLDNKCIVISTTTDKLDQALAALSKLPRLIITDSQVFKIVYDKKPAESLLTSFSVLFAAYKGDLSYYIKGAAVIDKLTERSRVLIAECCSHAPLTEDIGRVKIPNALKKRVGEGLIVDIVSGTDFPKDLTNYDLIIQCGACMFNRKYVLSRIDRAKKQEIPMSNYGVVLAYLSGILDKISYS